MNEQPRNPQQQQQEDEQKRSDASRQQEQAKREQGGQATQRGPQGPGKDKGRSSSGGSIQRDDPKRSDPQRG